MMAQSILPCQFCDGAAVLRWKCETCNLLLCEHCKVNRHLRVKGADTHSVIPIKNVGKTKADDMETEDVREMFATQPREVNTKVASSVLNTYTTHLLAVHRIVCFDDGSVCHSNNKVEEIITARLLRDSIKILHVRNGKVFDITTNENNDLLAVFITDTKLTLLSGNKDPEVVFDCSPLIILGMHYNKKTSELFLSARDSGPMFQVTRHSNRPVLILGPGYKRKATVEFSTDGKRLFTYPARIDSDDNGTIYVVDRLDEKRHGRVVAVSKNSDLKFTYSGYNQLNTSDSPFNPTDIAVTSCDHLVIADNTNYALHVLQTDGQLIRLQNTREVGITAPYSLAIDTDGFLLIGCIFCKNESAKIHLVKLTI